MSAPLNWHKWLVLSLLGLALSARPIGCDYSSITDEFGAEAVARCNEKCPFQVEFKFVFKSLCQFLSFLQVVYLPLLITYYQQVCYYYVRYIYSVTHHISLVGLTLCMIYLIIIYGIKA